MKSSTFFLNKANFKPRYLAKMGGRYKQDRIVFDLLLRVKDFTKLNSKLQKQVINFLKKSDLLDCMTIPYYNREYKVPLELLR